MLEPSSTLAARLTALASVTRVLHPAATLLTAKLTKEVTNNGLRGLGSNADLQTLLKLFQLSFKAATESKRCRRRR